MGDFLGFQRFGLLVLFVLPVGDCSGVSNSECGFIFALEVFFRFFQQITMF